MVAGLREAAWRLEADVVVVGSSRRAGLAGLPLRGTAERLIGRVPASVLVVPEVDDAADLELPGLGALRAARGADRSYPGRARAGLWAG